MVIIKYSAAFERDYQFYIDNKEKFNFCGEVINIIADKNGDDAKKAFWLIDSQGKKVACKEAILLKEIIVCKKSINLHIKMWSEGYGDCLMGVGCYIKEFINPPEWVERAFRKQLYKKIKM